MYFLAQGYLRSGCRSVLFALVNSFLFALLHIVQRILFYFFNLFFSIALALKRSTLPRIFTNVQDVTTVPLVTLVFTTACFTLCFTVKIIEIVKILFYNRFYNVYNNSRDFPASSEALRSGG
jgi:hypothetical protein